MAKILPSAQRRAEDPQGHTARDPEEVEVWCRVCNCKLFNSSIYEHPNPVIDCPHPQQCKEEVESGRLR